MALIVPKYPSSFFAVDNWGANPAATPGTTVTPGTSGAEGTYTEIVSDASVTEDIHGFYLALTQNVAAVAPKNQMLDIGIDPTGGTSYADIISNLLCGSNPVMTTTGSVLEWYFPLFIPSGSAIAARIRGVSATPGSTKVCFRGFGRTGAPEALPTGTFTETIGSVEDTSVDGTPFTPGNAADGNWTSLGASTRDMWFWCLGYQIDNATITAEYTYLELGYGDGTVGGTQTITKQMHGGTTGETVGAPLNSSMAWLSGFNPVPSGTNIYVRGRCLNAPDAGYQACAVGVGG